MTVSTTEIYAVIDRSRRALVMHRWMDVTVGKWLSDDPIDDDFQNTHRYANNNPLNATDPSGLRDNAESLTKGVTIKVGKDDVNLTVAVGKEIIGGEKKNALTIDLKSTTFDLAGIEIVQFIHRYADVDINAKVSKPRYKTDALKKPVDQLTSDDVVNEDVNPSPLELIGQKIDVGVTFRNLDNASIDSITATKTNSFSTKRDGKSIHFFDLPTAIDTNDKKAVETVVLNSFIVCTKTKSVLYRIHSEITYPGPKFPEEKRWGEPVEDGKLPGWALQTLEYEYLSGYVPKEEDGIWEHDEKLKNKSDVLKIKTAKYLASED